MTNTTLLEKKIEASGFKRSYIAKVLGLSAYGLKLKIHNTHEFKASEIDALCTLLGIDCVQERMSIFFAKKVD